MRVASKPLPAGEGRGEAEYPQGQRPRGPQTPPLPCVPPSSQPVELFKKSKAVEGREGGGGGGGGRGGGAGVGSSANGGMTAEKARAEVQWQNWKLESQVKKVLSWLLVQLLPTLTLSVCLSVSVRLSPCTENRSPHACYSEQLWHGDSEPSL